MEFQQIKHQKKLWSYVFILILTGLAAPKAQAVQKRPTAPANSNGVILNTPNPQTPIEHNNRGVELGSKGMWPEAIHEHELALKQDPYNKQFRTNLSSAQLHYGDLLASHKDYYKAMNQYRGALYADPTNQPAQQNLDNVLKLSGKDPNDINVRRQIAEDADVASDYETAIVEYRKCVSMADDGPSHAQLGRVLLKAGKVVDGFDELKIAVGKNWEAKDKIDLGAAHRQLGDVLKEYAYVAKQDGRGTIGMKRLLNAGIEYRRAVAYNPADADAIASLIEVARLAVAISPSFDNHLMLAGAYQLGGDFERAKMEYENCLKINPNSTVLSAARKSFFLAIVKSANTPPAVLTNAMIKIQESLTRKPNDPELLYLYGRGKEQQNENDAALTYYQKAAAINPYVNPDLKLGIARLTGGASNGASDTTAQTASPKTANHKQETVNKVNSTASSTSASSDTFRFNQVEKEMSSGNVDAAQKDLLDIVQKNPKDGHAWLLLGNTHEKKGDLDQAVVAYRQASYLKEPNADPALRQISTSRVAPLMQEANAAIDQKNWVKASSSLHEALSLGPELPFVHRKLAEVLKQMGDTKEADKELKKAAELEK